MTAFLVLGFFLGLKHALEADHVAAVAALATRSPRLGATVRVAVAWGAGHTLALIAFGSILLALDVSLAPAVARSLEAIVGIMLVVLGADVLRRLRRRRIHFHAHEHDGRRHLHAHGHAGEGAHDPAHHEHEHARGLLPRAVVVGGIHGMAGTAALTLLSLEALPSTGGAILYLALFGLGSVLGMALLSAVISLPFRFSAGRLARLSGGIEAALGAATILIGVWIVLESAGAGALAS